jgi:phosphinothricin acetyltransferase
MEVSVYVSQSHSGRGIGKKLLLRVIEESEAGGIWTLQSSIFPENTASIRLHKSCGFKLVGTREKIGMLNGKWRDTVIFERRSKKII